MDKKILEKNLNSLFRSNIFLIKFLKQVNFFDFSDIVEEKVENDKVAVYFNQSGNSYLLHSRYDTKAESEALLKNVDFNRDSLIIVFGLGLGYHLLDFKNKISESSRVIIVEPNINVLKYALTHVDLSSIFNTSQFFLIFGDENQINEQIIYQTGQNFYNMAYNTQAIMLPNYHVYSQLNKDIMKKIMQCLSSKIIVYGNSLQDMFNGFNNNYINVDATMESNCIDEIRGKYEGVPAIIVAAGPSLDKNIDKLKSAYGKALIISCDASMRACEKNGIKPDAIASIERDEPTYTYYYKDRTFDEDLVLLGPGLLWPNIFEEFPGKKILMSKQYEGVERWWHNYFDNVKYVNQGMSCATVAFAAAEAAGCNPIILIGQDLAFTEGKKHSDSTHTEFEGANDDSSSDDVYVKDYNGNLLRSHWVYKLFKEWFEYKITVNPKLEVIDATEGGAYIEGTKILTLEEAISTYCTKPIEKHLFQYLKDIVVTDEERIKKYEEIIEGTNKEVKRFKRLIKMSSEHFRVLNKIEEKYILSKCGMKELEDIVIKMQKGDKVVEKILNSQEYNTVKSFYQQIITQTIIFVKKIGNEITPENVQRNLELQKNLMYIIENSSKAIIKEYEKAREFVEDKKNKLEIKLGEI